VVRVTGCLSLICNEIPSCLFYFCKGQATIPFSRLCMGSQHIWATIFIRQVKIPV
jgi:hypothetical protein